MVARRKASANVSAAAANNNKEEEAAEEVQQAEIVENGTANTNNSVTAGQEEAAEEMQTEEQCEKADLEMAEQNADQNDADNGEAVEQLKDNAANDQTAEDATLEMNGTVNESHVTADNDKPLDRNFDNDSAAVVQHLSQLRLSVGPLSLEEIHDKALLPIMNACSGYQIHTPRVLNMEDDKTKYAMLDIEFLNIESAKENKEALIAHFATNDKVKIENWPENKIYYNDYTYLQMESNITTRMKDGVLIAGYSKLRDRWLVALGVEPEVSLDKIKELIGNDVVDIFRKESKKKAFIRFDTKEAAKSAINKSVTVNGKNIKLKELTPHPSEKKNFAGRNSYPGNMMNNLGPAGDQRNNFQNQRQQPYQPYYQQMGGPMPPYNPTLNSRQWATGVLLAVRKDLISATTVKATMAILHLVLSSNRSVRDTKF